MDKAAVFDLYTRTVRQHPDEDADTRIVETDGLVLSIGRFVFVSYWTIKGEDAPGVIHRLVNGIRKPGMPIIWRIYESDAPASLPDHLAAHGFVRHPQERLMVLDLETHAPHASDVRIVEVTDLGGYRDWITASRAAFGRGWPEESDEDIRKALRSRQNICFVAYDGDTPIGACKLWAPADAPFCGLLGGGVVPEARSRGVYRAMTDHRLSLARQRGYRYAAVDANTLSGPRLAAMGFDDIIGATTWTLDFPA